MSRKLVRVRNPVQVIESRGSRAITSREMLTDVAEGARHTGTEAAVAAEVAVATGRKRVRQRDGYTVLEQIPGCFGNRTVRRVKVDRYCTIEID